MAEKKKGPSRRSGAVSVGIAILAMLWTVVTYVKEGAGFQALFGVVLVFLCLAHAKYNFNAAKQGSPAVNAVKVGKKGTPGRYPVYHVKKKPGKVLKR